MSAQELVLLASALVPVILTVALYWFGVKIARRSEKRQQELDKLDKRG